MKLNEAKYRKCLTCSKQIEVGGRMVWVGVGWSHYACRFPEAAARADAEADAASRQTTLF